MGKLVFALIATCWCATPASAQSRVFLDGDMFADLKHFSSTSSGTSTLNGNAIGGGGSVGVVVADRWSVQLALDQGASTTESTPIPIGVLAGVVGTIPISAFQSQTTNRLFATSVLLGYHAASGRRVRPGVVGGLTFMHVWRRYTTSGPVPLATTSPTPVIPSLVIRPTETIDNVPAATVGAEAAIELTSNLAAVPEVRAHAFSLNGGPSGFAIRPGIAVRWTF